MVFFHLLIENLVLEMGKGREGIKWGPRGLCGVIFRMKGDVARLCDRKIEMELLGTWINGF